MSALFHHTPAQAAGVQGPAFSGPFRVLAVVLVAGLAAWFLQIAPLGEPGNAKASASGLGWFWAALGLLCWTLWGILRSHTRLDNHGLYQQWIWDKHMAYEDLAYAKLMRVRGLEWLIAPRLYARTMMGQFAVFYLGSHALVTEAEHLVAALREHQAAQL